MKVKRFLGKVDYFKNGRKNCPVYLEWELKNKENGIVFSMSADVWNHIGSDIYTGGQCVDKVAEFFPNDKRLARMVEVWNEYHLNDLNAGTPKQTAAIKQWKLINKYDYTAACEYLKSIGLYEDFEIDGLACAGGFPEDVLSGKRGYRYGERWIFRPIPAEIIAEIESW